MSRIETDILILGGGLSGLVAADLLVKKNLKVVILEKEPECGGLARTLSFKGFKYDIGGHRLCFDDAGNIAYIRGFLSSIGLNALKQKSRILFNDRYIVYPIDFSSVFGISKVDLAKICVESLFLNKNAGNGNFESWVLSNYGPTLYKAFFKDYTEKVWGRPSRDISSVWAAKRVGNNNIFTSLKNLFAFDESVKEHKKIFYYPSNGIGALAQGLEDSLRNKCLLFKKSDIGRFLIEDGTISSVVFVSDGNSFEVKCKKIFSTIPILELCKCLRKTAGPGFEDVEDKIKYRSLMLVNLIVDKKFTTDWHWCYTPRKDLVFARLYEPKYWNAALAPDQTKTLLCCEIFCNHEDRLWSSCDADLIKHVQEDLIKNRILHPGDRIVDGSVTRIRYAYPLLYAGFENDLREIRGRLASLNNICLAGRSGTHSYFDMEESIDDVKEKVDSLFPNQ